MSRIFPGLSRSPIRHSPIRSCESQDDKKKLYPRGVSSLRFSAASIRILGNASNSTKEQKLLSVIIVSLLLIAFIGLEILPAIVLMIIRSVILGTVHDFRNHDNNRLTVVILTHNGE